MSATKTKFMCLFRFPTDPPAKPSSPEEMQAQYAAWRTWMDKFKGELIPGGPLKHVGAAVVRGGNVTDGPYIEAKEVIASHASIETTSLARAIEIIQACPISSDPAYCVEIRETGF